MPSSYRHKTSARGKKLLLKPSKESEGLKKNLLTIKSLDLRDIELIIENDSNDPIDKENKIIRIRL